MAAPILWFASCADEKPWRHRILRRYLQCGAALDGTGNEEDAISAATIKARQFSKRILAGDL
jgi:hypothetical protein